MTELILVVQFTVGIVFLLSVGGKLRDPRAFARGIEDYEILPESTALGASLIIIVVEGWLAVAHLTGQSLRCAVPFGIGLLAVFAVAIAINLHRGRVLPCYCFDASSGEPVSGRTLLRLILLLSVEIFLLASTSWMKRDWHALGNNLHLAEIGWVFFWATFVLVAFSWLLSLPELAELLQRHKTKVMEGPESDKAGSSDRYLSAMGIRHLTLQRDRSANCEKRLTTVERGDHNVASSFRPSHRIR